MKKITVFATLSLSVVGCGSAQTSGQNKSAADANTNSWIGAVKAGATAYSSIKNMNDAQIADLGSKFDVELRKKGNILDSGSEVELIRQIGSRLAPASSKPDMQFQFSVVDSAEINAFATVGGYVYINKGLISFVKNNDELAGAIAHEMGHNIAKHVLEKLAEISAADAALASLSGPELIAALPSKVGYTVLLAPHLSRNAEFQADQLGFQNSWKAGYNACELVGFFSQMRKTYGDKSTIMSDHPSNTNRIEALLPLAQKLGIPGGCSSAND